jgi:Zn-dependent protease with chaperone function
MYLVVIMAFAFVLSEDLPPEQLSLLGGPPWTGRPALAGTLAVAIGQIIAIAIAAFVARRATLARLGTTAESHDLASGTFSKGQRVIVGMVAAMLIGTMILTPWIPLVRESVSINLSAPEQQAAWSRWMPLVCETWTKDGKRLGEWPLVGDLLILVPFFASLAMAWTIFYPVERRLRAAGYLLSQGEQQQADRAASNDATATLAAAKRKRTPADGSLGIYLLDKFRHQVLIIAAPMMIIVLAKHFTDKYQQTLTAATHLPWAADAVLGALSICTLALAPVILRYIWATEPLPAGALRERFVHTCSRIGLRYREILLWHTHGTAINAAVMGFVGPLRYILVSDALLETMDEEEIEAVFGHEAGHVRHWHLPFFGLFAMVSMYLCGGVIILLSMPGILHGSKYVSLVQLIGLATLLLVWLVGFGWLSRRFERQADVYGVRCVTPDVKSCVERCPVHGSNPSAGLCTSAANVFGRTLLKIADLNGIPKDAPSWRHGTIESRCRLIDDLAGDKLKLKRFDLGILWMKIGLVVASIIGTAAAGAIYGAQIRNALARLF